METKQTTERTKQEASANLAAAHARRINHARAVWRYRREQLITAINAGEMRECHGDVDYFALIEEIKRYGLSQDEILSFCTEMKQLVAGKSMDEIRRRPTPLKTLLRRHPVVFARRLNEFGENDWEVRQ